MLRAESIAEGDCDGQGERVSGDQEGSWGDQCDSGQTSI